MAYKVLQHSIPCMVKMLQRAPGIWGRGEILRIISNRHASSSTLDLSGILPPIATPFNDDESIAFDKLEENVKKWNAISFKGYVVQGSTGEFPYLSKEERVNLVRFVRKIAPKEKLIIGGSGCESTADTIELTAKMAEAGADAVMVVTPCYYKASMTNDAMVAHYTKVADNSPVPVILYSVPGNTAYDLAPEAVFRLAPHPNIIGMKESGGDITKIGTMVFKTKDIDFQILAGSAGFLYSSYAMGCVGGVCSLANVLGPALCSLGEFFKKGDLAAAQRLQQRLISPNACVTRRFGIPGLKAAMDALGYYGGPTRLPMLPVSEKDRATIIQVFAESGFM